MTRKIAFLGIALFLGTMGCNPSKAWAEDTVANKPGNDQTPSTSQGMGKVTRIVFVGKEHACECTRKRVDAGWAALHKALSANAKLPIEKLQIDTEGSKVEPYRQQKPMMALPAIYFIDSKGVVIELLQGEVTEEQIKSVLKR